jgi:cytochrome c biogenesis protein CcmG, thiol:disulfide interchange protein DsbE
VVLGFLRRWGARALDAVAILVVVAALVRFVVVPRLHTGPVPAPPVRLATLDGGRFDLAQRRGRLVFLDFYATWCAPCRDAIPLVQRFKRTHPGVDVVSVDVGEPAALARPFARSFNMMGVALDPDETVAHAFGVDGFPTVVAVDPHGMVTARWIGFNPDIERAMDAAATRSRATITSAL